MASNTAGGMEMLGASSGVGSLMISPVRTLAHERLSLRPSPPDVERLAQLAAPKYTSHFSSLLVGRMVRVSGIAAMMAPFGGLFADLIRGFDVARGGANRSARRARAKPGAIAHGWRFLRLYGAV
jgi:hypothetical protein